MTELPFRLEIDFICDDSNPVDEDLLINLRAQLSEISPQPLVNYYFKTYEQFKRISFYDELINPQSKVNIYYHKDLPADIKGVNIIIPSDTENLSDVVIKLTKSGDNNRIINLCEDNFNADLFLDNLNKIKSERCENVFMQPYLTQNEIKNFTKKILREFLSCASAWLNPIIHSNGDIYCCKFNRCGNLKQNSLLTVWNNEICNDFRQKIIQDKHCKNCIRCNKKFNDNFLIVDDARLEYKGNIYEFESVINYVKSCPKLAALSAVNNDDNFITHLIEIYNDEDLARLNKTENILLVIE